MSYYHQENNHYPNSSHTQTISISDYGKSTVDVSITTLTGNYDWTMTLQRYTNGTWRDVGSRTGYVNVGSPSNRTFTDVSTGGKLRIKLYWHGFATGQPGGAQGTVYIPNEGWTRPLS